MYLFQFKQSKRRVFQYIRAKFNLSLTMYQIALTHEALHAICTLLYMYLLCVAAI